jgi:peptidoglycan/LPS O-acetylase OafA/YrhL
MATCPKCGGYLSDDHRGFGAWRRITRAIGVVVAGALFCVVVVLALSEHPSKLLLAVVGLLGAVLVSALWRAIGF